MVMGLKAMLLLKSQDNVMAVNISIIYIINHAKHSQKVYPKIY